MPQTHRRRGRFRRSIKLEARGRGQERAEQRASTRNALGTTHSLKHLHQDQQPHHWLQRRADGVTVANSPSRTLLGWRQCLRSTAGGSTHLQSKRLELWLIRSCRLLLRPQEGEDV